jgi:hypothetical protein
MIEKEQSRERERKRERERERKREREREREREGEKPCSLNSSWMEGDKDENVWHKGERHI